MIGEYGWRNRALLFFTDVPGTWSTRQRENLDLDEDVDRMD